MRPWVLMGLLCAAATPAAAQNPPRPAGTAKLTYLTSTSAYIDAGRQDGLVEGTSVEVLRNGSTIATLKIAFLSSHQAACDIVAAQIPLAVGDAARFTPVATAPVPVVAADSGAPGTRAWSFRSQRGHAVRGRLGARYLVVRQHDSLATALSQPAFDLRLDGQSLLGLPLGLAVDVRARRTLATRPDGSRVTSGLTRVYQANLFLASPGGPARLTLGRQFSPTLSTVSLFDGVMGEFNGSIWGIGAFGGTEPDATDLSYSAAIQEVGGYLQLHNRLGKTSRWSLTSGAIGSYTEGKTNREFLYLQGTYYDRHVSGYVAEEIDYRHGWRLPPGGKPLALTSTFGTLNLRLTDGLSLHGGYDNRRNVRLYRDLVNPETTFDDSFREGYWGGAALTFARRLRVGAEARTNSGGVSGRSAAYTGSFGLDQMTRLQLSFRSRHTRYTTPLLSGWLHSVTLGCEPLNAVRLEVNAGLRSETDPRNDPARSRVTWVGADLDVSLARTWYLLLSATRQSGGVDGYDQVFASLSFRF